jgi:hypothetical protein
MMTEWQKGKYKILLQNENGPWYVVGPQ